MSRAFVLAAALCCYAAAQLAEDGPAGIDRLRDIAGRALCRSCSGIGLVRILIRTADPEGTVR